MGNFIIILGQFDYYSLKSHITDEYFMFKSDVFKGEIVKIKVHQLRIDEAFVIMPCRVLEKLSGDIFDEVLSIVAKDYE
jgi:hypothetical protein